MNDRTIIKQDTQLQTTNQHESLFITYYDTDVCIHEKLFLFFKIKKMYQILMNNLMKF